MSGGSVGTIIGIATGNPFLGFITGGIASEATGGDFFTGALGGALGGFGGGDFEFGSLGAAEVAGAGAEAAVGLAGSEATGLFGEALAPSLWEATGEAVSAAPGAFEAVPSLFEAVPDAGGAFTTPLGEFPVAEAATPLTDFSTAPASFAGTDVSSFAPGTDAIESIINASNLPGVSTATEGAQSLGFGGTEGLVSAANPGSLTLGGELMQGPANLLQRLGLNNWAQAAGKFNPMDFLRGGGGGLGGRGGFNLFDAGRGLYGMYQSRQMSDLAAQYAKQADPFGPYRDQYAQQLSALSANPSLITSMPGYQAGLDAVQRSLAAQGYQGSGNMMAALQQYGQQAYQQEMSRLASLAGAGFAPSSGATIGLQGALGASDILGSSLYSLGQGLGY